MVRGAGAAVVDAVSLLLLHILMLPSLLLMRELRTRELWFCWCFLSFSLSLLL